MPQGGSSQRGDAREETTQRNVARMSTRALASAIAPRQPASKWSLSARVAGCGRFPAGGSNRTRRPSTRPSASSARRPALSAQASRLRSHTYPRSRTVETSSGGAPRGRQCSLYMPRDTTRRTSNGARQRGLGRSTLAPPSQGGGSGGRHDGVSLRLMQPSRSSSDD
jgi:hypothetical protein